MGNGFRRSSKSSTGNDDDIDRQTFDEFYEILQSQLTEDHINQLQILFSFVNLRQVDLKENLVKYLTRCPFKQVYKNELKYFRSEAKVHKIVNQSLDKHCCSVLLMHSNIMKHIKDPVMLEIIMNQIALSHCFISNAQSNFKMHDLILSEFIREEFHKSMNFSTHQALNRYISLIGDRFQLLIEYFIATSRPTDILKAMKTQREHVENYTKNSEEIKELYVNTKLESVSELCLVLTSEDSSLSISKVK